MTGLRVNGVFKAYVVVPMTTPMATGNCSDSSSSEGIRQQYDYVVVGGGTSGLVIAICLTENTPSVSLFSKLEPTVSMIPELPLLALWRSLTSIITSIGVLPLQPGQSQSEGMFLLTDYRVHIGTYEWMMSR
ncbi:aryl-alcohol dehydrogenase [Penicillium atrosanguineum]|uniref:uncharacterized protein n=1 Tax=Penicillium atrosanguineum TaxID=1132637 RepID=UPI00239E7EDC|nr:uncharacterized protein N7443_003008 [Penicillium atrosanguineum]KAJ5117098.1 aryl-alcohol dehydrogenase [Penicillium atrosanguineum]KAJ5140638.1 aryl-alcohol dehydrogenase [Penicillium atrosanguineum]KAJ5310547.1 hypothetical protein N7443_003008 [Penicillium atrosanguineum]